MKVSPVHPSIFTPKTTGYASAAAMGACVLSAVSKNKTFKKMHKPLSLAAVLLTVFHVGLTEYYNYKYRVK